MIQKSDLIQTFTVFVGGLNFQTDETDLKNFFSSYPLITGIENIRICRRIEGASKGFGYVTFNNKPSYIQSLSLNGYLLDGRNIRIEVDHGKKTILSSRKKRKESRNSNTSSISSSPVKRKKVKVKSRSESSESSSYSSYSYSYSSPSSSPSSYSSYSSDTEKRNQNNRRKNKKRKRRGYSDYSYSS